MLNEIKTFQPRNLRELDELLVSVNKPVTYVAGGTDIMIQEEKWGIAGCLVDLTSIEEMCTVTVRNASVLIGAATPLSDLMNNSHIKRHFPILIESCRQIGSVQIQNRATLGGNIANASPAGDSLPVLSVLDATLWIGPRHENEFRKLNLDEFMLGPGETNLTDNQYIVCIQIDLPNPENQFWYFRKVGQRYSMAISKLSLAVYGWLNDGVFKEIRICSGSVSPKITRATKIERLLTNKKLTEKLIGEASEQMAAKVDPISDIRSTIAYRRATCGGLLREALHLAKQSHK